MPHAVLTVDADGTVVAATPAAASLLDESPTSLRGTQATAALPGPDDGDLPDGPTLALDDGSVVDVEVERGEDRRWIHLAEPDDWAEPLVEALGDAVYVLDDSGTVTYVNDVAVDLLGYDEADLVGSPVDRFVDEADAERGRASIQRLLDGGPPRQDSYEMDVIDADGDRTPVENHLRVLTVDGEFVGTTGVLRDVTERKRRIAELEQYETIMQALPDPVYATDAEGRIGFANHAFESVFGFGNEGADPVHFSECTTDEDTDALLSLLRELYTDDDGSRATLRMEGRDRNGRRRRMENSVALLPADDGFRGAAGVLRDVTGAERRREVVSVLNRALRHNLRTHVSTISGYAEMLRPKLDDPDDQRYVDYVVESAEWLVKLGRTLRNLQRAIEEDREGYTGYHAGELVDDVVSTCRDQFPEATIRTHESVDATVDAGNALVFALENVVENAVVHNDGCPNVDVWIADAPREGWVDIYVEDDGPGIPESERSIVLGDAEIGKLNHSEGVGLWIARWTAEVYGGDVLIEDRDPTGSVVTFRLPRVSDDPT